MSKRALEELADTFGRQASNYGSADGAGGRVMEAWRAAQACVERKMREDYPEFGPGGAVEELVRLVTDAARDGGTDGRRNEIKLVLARAIAPMWRLLLQLRNDMWSARFRDPAECGRREGCSCAACETAKEITKVIDAGRS
jgi:hypothetical protein